MINMPYIYIYTQMFHVWYIYLHLPHKWPSHVGEYTIPVDHLGNNMPSRSRSWFCWSRSCRATWKPFMHWLWKAGDVEKRPGLEWFFSTNKTCGEQWTSQINLRGLFMLNHDYPCCKSTFNLFQPPLVAVLQRRGPLLVGIVSGFITMNDPDR